MRRTLLVWPSFQHTCLHQVTPAFSKNPVLKQAERMKKMTDAEEQAARKADIAKAMALKSSNPDGDPAIAAAADGGGGEGAASSAKKSTRLRSEAEIIDSHVDFKIKKSGAIDRGRLSILLV